MAKSNNRVALKSVIVVREGKRVSPPIGKSFPFTAEEVEALEESNPTAIRAAVNEDEQADVASVVALANTSTRVVAKSAKPGAGKTTAMVDGLDGTAAGDQTSSDASDDDDDDSGLTITQIKAGLTDLDDAALDAALAAEKAGSKRAGAIAAYDGEIAKRKAAAAAADDDL